MLPIFAVYSLMKALIWQRHYDVVLLGDGVLGVVGFCIKCFTRKRVVAVIHGLDVSYSASLWGQWYERYLIALYRRLWLGRFLPSLDLLIAVSRDTRDTAIAQGLNGERIIVIANGVEEAHSAERHSRADLQAFLGHELQDQTVLLTLGRLVRRKGVAWFVEHVMPDLPPCTLYLIAGAGNEESRIRTLVEEKNLFDRVRLLGKVTNAEKELLLQTIDIFVQPNITVPGDKEGFGIAVIEAAFHARPVVAAAIEGLLDAITPDRNGLLVPSGDANAFGRTLTTLLKDKEARELLGTQAREFTRETFHWSIIVEKYLTGLERVVPPQ